MFNGSFFVHLASSLIYIYETISLTRVGCGWWERN
nr:MAG TPA: hypothetical protein [Caudoviricetes sp.]